MKGNSGSSAEKKPQNKTVLDGGYAPSQNFFDSDRVFRHYLKHTLTSKTRELIFPRLSALGAVAATKMDGLSQKADKHPPVLSKRNFLGETVDELIFHPAYDALVKIAVDSGMFRIKWHPDSKAVNKGALHHLSFSLAFVYGLAESGVCCPLCMTDGAAKIIDKYAEKADRVRLMRHIYTENHHELFTGAMFLTEKSGGSDVGAIGLRAQQLRGSYYLLNGEKWFCSNAGAQIKLVLARTGQHAYGTKGLSLFLVEPKRVDGTKNPMDIIRLKDKLGTRSMASAEIVFADTEGKLIGREGEGFKIMAEMINLSRIWNSVIALAAFRRSLVEAFQFLSHRHSFGKRVLEHPLVRGQLFDLGTKYIADFYITWKAIALLDKANDGNAESAKMLRLLTPLIKKQTAETAVYAIRECMELMGGLGYIEDGILPKFMRDTLVLPIWEGTSNMMVLDFIRVSQKTEGLQLILHRIKDSFSKQVGFEREIRKLNDFSSEYHDLLKQSKEEIEFKAKPLAEQLTLLIQLSLLLDARTKAGAPWLDYSIDHLRLQLTTDKIRPPFPPSSQELIKLIGWQA
ncbi:acyl-CoA dehydrogenase family protein [Echinicola sediminis]